MTNDKSHFRHLETTK